MADQPKSKLVPIIIGVLVFLFIVAIVAFLMKKSGEKPADTSTGNGGASVQPILPEHITMAGTTTYSQAEQLCAAKGKKLCGASDVCSGGPGSQPLDGMRNIDTWVPIAPGPNNWLSVGNYDPDVRLCRTHGDLFGPPVWGEDGAYDGPFRTEAYCCPN